MKPIIFKGVGTAMATPFTKDGINFEELAKFIDFQLSEGVNSLIVCGTTGESSTMSNYEKMETIKFTVNRVKKQIPIIAGTGSNNTKQAIELSKYAESVGASALLIVTPYYNKTTQKGLVIHYSEIAKNVNIPIILYNVPSRTGVNIEPETCLELSKIPNIVAIKEASGNISQVAKIAQLCGNDLYIYSGNDDQILPILSLGGIGVISVLSNVKPKLTCNIVNNFFDGNLDLATSLQLSSLPLINALFSEVNPIPVKEALNLIGYDFGEPRLPLVKFSEDKIQMLKNLLNSY